MNESRTTLIFVGAAVVLALAALGSNYMNQPTNSDDFELVGQPFFEDFTSASQARSLEVAAVDPESARLKRFSVENQDGLWRIPSHYDYPAEAAARLAKTASSVMGVARDSLAGRLAKEHERLGVLDPLADDIEDPEGAGKRITMKDQNGDVVVDYIVGKEAGEVALSASEQPFGTRGNEKYYYIRRPDEQQTYKVKLDLDLSTKFSDWIDPDLLRVETNDVTRISIDNYTLEEDQSNPLAQNKALYKSQGDKLDLARPSSTDAWSLVGLNTDHEELKTERINQILGVLDQMKIAGVRPKYKYQDQLLLTPDLKLNTQPEFEKNPQEFGRAINRLQNELDQKGFNLAGSSQKLELVAHHGDLEIGTNQGVVYTLHVGKAFDGDETAIEIGSSGDSDSDSAPATSADSEPTESETGDDPDPAEPAADANADDSEEELKNRYLMVRVSFDPTLITPQPVEPTPPTAPVKPEGYQPPVESDSPDAKDDAETAGDEGVEKPPGEQEPERDAKFVAYDQAMEAFRDLEIDYELAKTKFKTDTEAFNKQVEAGQTLVNELNERFADWYYVITGDNLKSLQTVRKDLITVKETPPGEQPARPNISFPDLPGMTDPAGKPSVPPNQTPGDETGNPDTQPAVDAGKDSPPEDSPKEEPAKEKADPAKDDPAKADPAKADPATADPGKSETSEANNESENKSENKTEAAKPDDGSQSEPDNPTSTSEKNKSGSVNSQAGSQGEDK